MDPELASRSWARPSALWLGSKVLFRASPPKHGRFQLVIKRGLDLVLASLLLIATLPILMAIAVIIAFSSGLPVFFKRKRVTKGARPFTMLKFRTMRKNANRFSLRCARRSDRPLLLVRRGSPSTLKIGAFLRRFNLDELSQLLNVLRGDINLVGPRLLALEQVEANRELLTAPHEVRAGMTGWWQVNGRSNLTPDQVLALDRFYIENWSLALDLRVPLKTPRAILTRRGAY
jgi:lipopolysaccharide/colanic/teichoic acid biosynthesis glycosyltransferase